MIKSQTLKAMLPIIARKFPLIGSLINSVLPSINFYSPSINF
jgi:hypothetical protein